MMSFMQFSRLNLCLSLSFFFLSGSEREGCDTYLLLTLFVSMVMMYMMYTRNQP